MKRLLMAFWCVTLAAAPPQARRVLLRVPVWSENGQAASIKDLTARVEGTQARVAGVHGAGDGMVLLLVLDLVGDIAHVDAARQALATGLEKLPGNVYVGLMRAQDGLRVLQDPTPERGKLIEIMKGLSITGKAGLLDSVETTARLGDAVSGKANVRLAALYVTDSSVYNYREDYTNPVINYSDSRDISRHFPEGLIKDKISKLDASLAETQTPLFVLHLDYSSDRLNEAYQAGLMQLAKTTGGTSIFCRSIADIEPGVEKMLHSIAGMQTLLVELPPRPLKSAQVELEGASGLNYRTRFVLNPKKR